MLKDPDVLRDVNTKVAATVLGTATSTVREMAKRGLIKKIDGPQGHWDLTELVPAYIQFRTGSRRESTKQKLTEQQERKLSLANDKEEGKLIPVEHASGVFAEYASAFRAGITALPGRVSSQLAGMSKPNSIRAVLNDEINELLTIAEQQLEKLQPDGQASGVRSGRSVDSEADASEKSGSVGGRKPHSAKRKRGARKVEK